MEWTIRAVFDLLFMMCHLIASTSPYHTLLLPHITVQNERGSQEESGRERNKYSRDGGVEVGARQENPLNPI